MLPFGTPILLLLLALTACTPPNPLTSSYKNPEVRPLTMPQVTTTDNPFQVAVFHGCYDGDTCTVSLPNSIPALFGDHITVRLAGVDSPEIKGMCEQEKAMAAKAQALTQSLMGQATTIELTEPRRDKYFRILARVMNDGHEVAQELVKAGLARRYDGGKKVPWCLD